MCNHFRKCGPLGCLIGPSNPDGTGEVGIWRWLICESCGAHKRWDVRTQTHHDVEWQEPTQVSAQKSRATLAIGEKE